jgi:broad specificity phosphatase PhoE
LIWLFRHGQAGTRNAYDALSDLGRVQARRLGQYLAGQPVEFAGALTGELTRQRETAEEAAAAYRAAGRPFPPLECNPGWNEFDLDAVYRDIAPVLAASDPSFAEEYEAMREVMADDSHGVHREWTRCDLLVFRAWMEGRIPTVCETFQAFTARIAGALERAVARSARGSLAVFTSATPIGVACGLSLDAGVRTHARLAGALYNASWSALRVSNGEPSLFSFNNIPHLAEESLRSFR